MDKVCSYLTTLNYNKAESILMQNSLGLLSQKHLNLRIWNMETQSTKVNM